MKKNHVVNLFLLGTFFASTSCKTSQVTPSPTTKPLAKTGVASAVTTPKFTPWRQSLIAVRAHEAHEKTDFKVMNSDTIALAEKGEVKTLFISNAMVKADSSLHVTIPANTIGTIVKFIETTDVPYLAVSYPLKSGSVIVYYKEQSDGTYTLCINDADTKMNVAETVYKGRPVKLSIKTDQAKKHLLLASVTHTSVKVTME